MGLTDRESFGHDRITDVIAIARTLLVIIPQPSVSYCHMKTIYVSQSFPHSFHKSLYLAGPTPRDPTVSSWRPQALRLLESLAYDGVVFVPESQEGQRS